MGYLDGGKRPGQLGDTDDLSWYTVPMYYNDYYSGIQSVWDT